jgi:hypothetical protein
VRAHPRYIELRNAIWEMLKSEQEPISSSEASHDAAQ